MWINKLEIKDFRAFTDTTKEAFEIPIGQHITCIAGHNGVGKSTILAMLSNCGEIKGTTGKHLNGEFFRGEYSNIIKGDRKFDTTGEKCTMHFSDLPTNNNPTNPYVDKLSFRATFQKNETKKKNYKELYKTDKQKTRQLKNFITSKYIFNKLKLTNNETPIVLESFLNCFSNYFSTNSVEFFTDKLKDSIMTNMKKDDIDLTKDRISNISETLLKISNSDTFIDLYNNGAFFQTEETTISDRYRLLPQKSAVRNTEKKLDWPTYYLGLSRLYPVGESDEALENEIDEAILKIVLKKHKEILNSVDESIDAKGIQLANVSKKKGFGVQTKTYGSLANSSGQDNLGQILLTIESFKFLKEQLKKKYNGGIFLIDEIDATLHPAAQNKLFDYIYQQAKKLNLQVVFTTHSISLLEHILKTNNLNEHNDAIKVIHFSNARNSLEMKINPNLEFVKNDMLNTYQGITHNNAIDVYTEDQVARWFLENIIKYSEKNIKLNYLDIEFGWEQIISLIKLDYNYFSRKLVVLDSDVNSEENRDKLLNLLKKTRYNFDSPSNKNTTRILALPGSIAIEKIFWEYISNLEENHAFYHDPESESYNLTKRAILDFGPFENKVYQTSAKNDLHKIKRWFEDNLNIIDILFKYWYKDNASDANKFIDNLDNEYQKVLSRIKNI